MTHQRSFSLPMLALVIAAVAWGSTVVVAKSAYDSISAAELMVARMLLSFCSVLIFIPTLRRAPRSVIYQGALLGFLYNGSLALQMVGLQYTAPSLSGFITASYVIFTALISVFLLKARQRITTWVAVALTVGGISILALGHDSGVGFGFGAAITLIGAFGFAFHIVLLGKWVRKDNLYPLIFMQAATGAVGALIALPFLSVSVPTGPTIWLQLIYLGVFCGGVTLFLQSWAQNYVPPTPASVVMCTEPVWGAWMAVAFGFEPLTTHMMVGGIMVVIALMLTVIPRRRTEQLEKLLSDLRRRQLPRPHRNGMR